MHLQIKNYKSIREADIEISGLTFLYSQSASGKSTIFEALKSLLANKFNESSFLHGETHLEIEAEFNGDKVKIVRDSQTGESSLSFNDEPPLTKLGRNHLHQLCRFPIRDIIFPTEIFYPNVASQFKIPVFDTISVYDLFSSMFTSIAQLSEAVTDTKAKVAENRSELNAATKTLEILESQESEISTQLTKYKNENPDIDKKIIQLNQAKAHRDQLQSLQNELAQMDTAEFDLLSKDAASLGLTVNELPNAVAKISGLLKQFEEASKAIGRIRQIEERISAIQSDPLYTMEIPDTKVLSLMSDFQLKESQITRASKGLEEVNSELTKLYTEVKNALPEHCINSCPLGSLNPIWKTMQTIQ